MKRLATGLFLLAAVVFVLCVVLGRDVGWVGYVRATAEASMVGALADWFAVTALFRHPLGVPIPHTAIIPRKKDQIGESLGAFVQENFLTRAVVEHTLENIDVPARLGALLTAPGRAERLAGDAGAAVGALGDLLRDEEIQPAVAALVDRRLQGTPAAPVLARVLELVVDGDRHQEVLSAGLRGLARFLEENRVVFRAQLGDASPSWVPDWVDDRVFVRVFAGLQQFLDEVGDDPRHELRRSYDDRLRAYIHALRTDPARPPGSRTSRRSCWSTPPSAPGRARSGRRPRTRCSRPPPTRSPSCARGWPSWCGGAGGLLQTDPTVRELVQRQALRTGGYLAERFAGDIAAPGRAPPSPAGTPRRPAGGSSCRSAATCSGSGSTAPWSGGLAGLVIYTIGQLL